MWTLAGSNRLPLLCHRSALPSELRAQILTCVVYLRLGALPSGLPVAKGPRIVIIANHG